MFKYTRLKKLLNAILESDSLADVYRLSEKFVGDNTQISGTISHRNMQVSYHFVFNREQHYIQVGLTVNEILSMEVPSYGVVGNVIGGTQWGNGDVTYTPPIFNLQINVKEDQLPILQTTIVSFLSMLR